jgi:acyl carrier protein
MGSPVHAAEQALRGFLSRMKKTDADLDPATPLYANGIGLDSLETAELSAVLEDEFGTDPFSASEQMPQTVGDILDFYRAGAVSEV